jgi:hypothetical protein
LIPEPGLASLLTELLQATGEHILLIDSLMAQYKIFSQTFHPLGRQLLKYDHQYTDNMALIIRDMAPDCKPTALDDLASKFEKAIEKYESE